jgi:hypothetical protein
MTDDSKKDINESMRLIKTHKNKNKEAKVYKDTNFDEYRVRHFTDGKHHEHADYHTNDLNDAHDTAKMHLKEESIAASTLHPGARAVTDDPKSKLEYINKTIGAMHSMKKTDLEKWFTDAMNLIGKEYSELPNNANEKSNEASIKMHDSGAIGKVGPSVNDPMPKIDHKNNPLASSMKEEVNEMFEGQDLSEEFKEKASTIFEAAINARAILEVARLQEEYEALFEEKVNEIKENLETQLDTYLEYVVEKWMSENEVAIESTLRNEIMEEFIDGLRGLFAEHYIDIPEDKVSVIEELASKVTDLESRLDESIIENVQLKKFFHEVEKQEAFAEMANGLTMTEKEKFEALAEGIEFDNDIDSYKRKLSYVRESYFTNKLNKPKVSNIEEETFEVENTDSAYISPEISAYAKAISRTVKK